ncbi:MAG: hypothetical protein LDLANPLL_02720 [Turneriella sp.]|nr:hypothetical protein [Turneriella sp.]
MARHTDFPVDSQFTDRWSPRGFDPNHTLTEEEIGSLFEAARFAPSRANEQPWVFYREKDKSSRDLFLSFLTGANAYWVKHASLVVIVCARKRFSDDNTINDHARFDTGAAWVSLAFEARKRGLYAHCMSGIYRETIYEKLGINPDGIDVIAAIAVGKKWEDINLSDKHKSQEEPNNRKKQTEFVFVV